MDVHRRDRAATRDQGRLIARSQSHPSSSRRSGHFHWRRGRHFPARLTDAAATLVPRRAERSTRPMPALTHSSVTPPTSQCRRVRRRLIDDARHFLRAARRRDARRGRHRSTRCGGRLAFTWRCSSIASTDVEPGLYMLVRDDADARAAAGRVRARVSLGARGGRPAAVSARARRLPSLAARLSCDQEIAADGFFSLGMIAELRREPRRVRALVLSPPVLGNRCRRAGALSGGRGGGRARDRHRLFLRRSGARRARASAATLFKALYHFTVGMPVEDSRLTTEPATVGTARRTANLDRADRCRRRGADALA